MSNYFTKTVTDRVILIKIERRKLEALVQLVSGNVVHSKKNAKIGATNKPLAAGFTTSLQS